MLVDTSVWSLALRRSRTTDNPHVRLLNELVSDGRVAMTGPIRQEVLSGVRAGANFERLRDHLRAFPDVPLAEEDFERAAEWFNLCRARGIQGSNTDFLICAVAERCAFEILTTDLDFAHLARVIPLTLHAPLP